jgi:hypothetical protein
LDAKINNACQFLLNKIEIKKAETESLGFKINTIKKEK